MDSKCVMKYIIRSSYNEQRGTYVTCSHRSIILMPLTEYSADTYNIAIKCIIDSHLWERGGPYFGQLLSQASTSHGILINRDSIQERPNLHCRY
jgi:hypothetical protein